MKESANRLSAVSIESDVHSAEQEINSSFAEISQEILEAGLEENQNAVTSIHRSTLVGLMKK